MNPPMAWKVGELRVGEWRSEGAAKNAKFAKASNLRKTPLFDFDS